MSDTPYPWFFGNQDNTSPSKDEQIHALGELHAAAGLARDFQDDHVVRDAISHAQLIIRHAIRYMDGRGSAEDLHNARHWKGMAK